MENVDRGLIEFLFNQGTGVAFGMACLVALVLQVRQHSREKDDWRKEVEALNVRFNDVLRDRKMDRDHDLRLKARIETHLDRIDRFNAVIGLAEAEYELGPKRRAMDRAVADALRQRDKDDP